MIIAGTGHRPKYCPCKYKEDHPWLNVLRSSLSKGLLGVEATKVISGMAIGFDTWLAQEALLLDIPLHAYVPFKGQGSKWPSSSRKEYDRILGLAERIIYVSEEYSNEAFLKRDKAMIDNCDKVFSLLNPETSSGGTYYTVKYANKQHKDVVNFWR